ncbi:hypothetical protein GCM10022406_27960 [Hymenobacter algoricola]|uniref:Ig-like domain-containing protein n=2 Tax=Hymenobacter algoricola TaxID=486267 RepID=A0ABP7NDI6_9BACT
MTAAKVPPTGYIQITKGAGSECLNSVVTYTINSNSGCTDIEWKVVGGQFTELSPTEIQVLWNAEGEGTIDVHGTFTDLDKNPSRVDALQYAIYINSPPQEQLIIREPNFNIQLSSTICEGGQTKLMLKAPAGAYDCVWSTLQYAVSKNTDATELVVAPTATITYTLTYKSHNFICVPLPIACTITVKPLAAAPIVTGNIYLGPNNPTLTVTNVDPLATYNWYDANGLSLNRPGPQLSLSNVTTGTLYHVEASSCRRGIFVPVQVHIYSVQIVLATTQQMPTGPVPLHRGTGMDLRAKTLGGGTYQWRRNGTILPGATAQKHVATQVGTYEVIFTDGNGTSAASQPVDITDELIQQSHQGNPLSYASQTTVLKPGQTTYEQIKELVVEDRSQQVTYFDGFGRPIQQHAVLASPAQTDLVQSIVYDQYGQTPHGFLPFAAASADTPGRFQETVTAQQAFYQGTDKVAVDAHPFTTTTVELSPLQRVTQQQTEVV